MKSLEMHGQLRGTDYEIKSGDWAKFASFLASDVEWFSVKHSEVSESINMGQAIGSVIDDNERKHETDTIEQLQSLQRMVQAKIEAESGKLNKEAFDDPRLPIVSVVNMAEKYSLKVESAPNEKINKCLDNVVGGGYLEGVQKLLSIA